MKRNLFGLIVSLATVGLMVACHKDPTASLRGGIERVSINRSYVEMNAGDIRQLEATAYDAQGNVVAELPTVTVEDPSILELAIDSFRTNDPLPRVFFSVEALTAGRTTITATAGGVSSDPTAVIAFPLEFDGTISVAPYDGGNLDLLTISGTSVLSFDEGTTVTIGDSAGYIVSQTASELQVLAQLHPAGKSNAVVTINNLLFLGEIVTTLSAPETVNIRPTYFSTTYNAGGVLTDLAYPVRLNAVVSAQNDGLFATVRAGATDLTITATLSWDSNSDIDIYWTEAGWNDYVGNFDGATLSNPEVSQVTIPAGETWLVWLEHFGPADADIVTFEITSP